MSRVALFCKEYPPHVYGGAGVHVEYLARELARLVEVEVRCFGDQDLPRTNPRVRGYTAREGKQGNAIQGAAALDALSRNLAMARDPLEAQVVHCHTWYADMAGLLAHQLWGVPFVVTTHSLEPMRPWKEEQLGAGYRLSAWMEKTAIEQADAVIAVSRGTREDILRHFSVDPGKIHVIHNGIDLEEYRKTDADDALGRHGVDRGRPYVLFVGRISRQKGILHLLDALPRIDRSAQVVLCAGAPDTEEIGREVEERARRADSLGDRVVWIREMLPREEVVQLYSHAAVFCCPSVYEPFGIINLEAMACETAVVASSVGGIPEVVTQEETGILVDPMLEPGSFQPADPKRYAAALADGINRLIDDQALREGMGRKGRIRVEEHFSWSAIARATLDLYGSLRRRPNRKRRGSS